MAVSGKTAAPWEVPYLLESDIPDMGAGDKAIAERVHEILAGTKQQALTWLKPGAANQIIVCNAAGVPQYVTPKGAATLAEDGTLTLANPSVSGYIDGTGKITSGSGFTVERTKEGSYTITLSAERGTVLNPVAVAESPEATLKQATIFGNPGKKTFTVRCYKVETRVLTDCSFFFIVRASE
jgi:hypothetical protein